MIAGLLVSMSLHITNDDITPCLLGDTVITTLTTHGYLLYTLNMLKSLQPFGLDKKVLIIAMDSKAYRVLIRLGYHTVCMNHTMHSFYPWNSKGYDTVCYFKLELIYQILSLNKHVLLVDGDIVFQQDPSGDIAEWNESTEDVWIQNDSLDDDDIRNMCTGYMFIRSNEKMIDLYHVEDRDEKYATCALRNNDQTYFNDYVKPFSSMAALPLRLYPNGNVFYNAEDVRETAILVHFNWVKGHEKLVKMKKYGMWLLTPEEEST